MKCTQCNSNKHYTQFRVYKSGKRRKICRLCENISRKKLRTSKLSPQQKYIYDYLLINRCIFCGFSNPVCLDFHHVNPKTKSYEISQMVKDGYTIDEIKLEINKCVVLCSNCHRLETARIQNNYKYRSFYKL